MVYVIQVCRQLSSRIRVEIRLQSVYKPVWHIPLLSVQPITPDEGQRSCPKHVEFIFQNKFETLVHLVGFIVREFVTMHGHMSRCTVTCHDARSHVTMHGHMSRCTVTCHDARSHVTMHGHMNVKITNVLDTHPNKLHTHITVSYTCWSTTCWRMRTPRYSCKYYQLRTTYK
jgi:hypothetical protein